MYRVLFLDQSQVFDISIEMGAASLTERGADIATKRRTNHPNVDPSLDPSIQDLHQVLPQACSISEPSLACIAACPSPIPACSQIWKNDCHGHPANGRTSIKLNIH
jgi:hypothetical protein